jgi:hypothetical protein
MPDTSNDLLMEMLKELLHERSRDMADGITLRVLNRQHADHALADEKRHYAIEERIRELEKASSRQEGVMDTGRFTIQPNPAPQIIPIIDQRRHSSRPSIVTGAIRAVVRSPHTITALIAAATVLIHAIMGFFHR